MKKVTKYLLALCLSFKALSACSVHVPDSSGFDPDAATGGSAASASANVRVALTFDKTADLDLDGWVVRVLPTRALGFRATETIDPAMTPHAVEIDLRRLAAAPTTGLGFSPIADVAAHVASAPVFVVIDAGKFSGTTMHPMDTAPTAAHVAPLCLLLQLVKSAPGDETAGEGTARKYKLVDATVAMVPAAYFSEAREVTEGAAPGTSDAHTARLAAGILPLVNVSLGNVMGLDLGSGAPESEPRLHVPHVTVVGAADLATALASKADEEGAEA